MVNYYTTIQSILNYTRMFFDILIMWLLLYYTIKIVRNNSRTIQIFKGIVLILVIKAVANVFGLNTVGWIADMFVSWGFIAVIIISSRKFGRCWKSWENPMFFHVFPPFQETRRSIWSTSWSKPS